MRTHLGILFLLFLAISTSSMAYMVGTKTGAHFSQYGEKDVFLVAQGDDLYLNFYDSALTSIRKHKELFPHREVVLIWAREFEEKDKNEKAFASSGLTFVHGNNNELGIDELFNIMKQLKNVKSLHIFAHASAIYGFGIQKDGPRFHAKDPRMAELASIFEADAYGFFYGCNTGYIQAKVLSQLWKMPIFASFNATDFQELHSRGEWFFHNEGQFPKDGNWKPSNDQSFDTSVSCSERVCTRMKPDSSPYNGYWGEYDAGLPFFKLICNFDMSSQFEKKKCFNSFYKTAISFPGTVNVGLMPTFEEYKKAVIDFLCPISQYKASTRSRSLCEGVLAEAEILRTWIPYTGMYQDRSLTCDFSGCNFSNGKGLNVKNQEVTVFQFSGKEDFSTLTKEYLNYLDAYQYYRF